MPPIFKLDTLLAYYTSNTVKDSFFCLKTTSMCPKDPLQPTF